MKDLSKYHHLAWLLLLVPVYLFLFVKLGAAHIRLWDEGWFAVHAVEMWQNGSWFVSYFDGEPSYTSSKPPLQTWLQIASLSLFGISEVALRLPSALAAAVTVFLIYFLVKRHDNLGAALMTALVLLTSVGFVNFHTARGAEADALLTLCLTAQAWCLFQFTQTRNWKWFIGFSLSVAAAFWTKSVAGFLLLPAFVVYLLGVHRELLVDILRSWISYVSMILVAGLVVLYVFWREKSQPGYVTMFFKSNVGRYTSSVGHNHGVEYFLRNLLDGRYQWWMVLAIIGMIASFFIEDKAKSLVLFASVCAIVYMLVISFSKSKLVWYDMPFYPFAAISASYGIRLITQGVNSKLRIALLVTIFLFPSYQMFLHAQANRLNLSEMNFESQEIYLHKAYQKETNLDNLIVVHDHFKGSLVYYKHKYATKGQTLDLRNNVEKIKVGDTVLLRSPEHKAQVVRDFEVDKLDEYKTAELYKIAARKTNID